MVEEVEVMVVAVVRQLPLAKSLVKLLVNFLETPLETATHC